MNEQETITDIIKKIRAEADFIEETARGSFKAGEAMGGIAFTESDLESALDLAETKRKEADRLEAALKREMSKNVSKNGADFGQLGNAAKLREALDDTVGLLEGILEAFKQGTGGVYTSDVSEAIDKARAALAAPARNCDVGTAEEQEVRFRNYCWNHSSRDKNMECQCPIDAEGKAGCKLTWAQLPYEEGGNDGK